MRDYIVKVSLKINIYNKIYYYYILKYIIICNIFYFSIETNMVRYGYTATDASTHKMTL